MKPYMLFDTDRIIDDGDFAIYYARHIQSLFKVNKITGETKLLWRNSTEDFFRSFVRYKDKCVFFPSGAGNGGILDLKRNDFKCLEIPQNLHLTSEHNWSANYIRYMDLLFFYFQNPVVTQYNLLTNEWKIYRDWRKDLPSNISPNQWMTWESFLHNDKLYFPIGESKYMLEIAPKTGNMHVIDLNLPTNIIEMHIGRYSNGELYLLCKNKNNKISILKSNSFLTEEFEEVMQVSALTDSMESFISAVVGNKYLWLFPCVYDKAYKINLKNGISEIAYEIPVYNKLESECNYVCGLLTKNFYWTININTGELVELNLLNDKVRKVKMSFSPQDYKKLIIKDSFMYESSISCFEEWLCAIGIDSKGAKPNDYIPDNFLFGNDCGNYNSVVDNGEKSQSIKTETKLDYHSAKHSDYMAECKKEQKWHTVFF